MNLFDILVPVMVGPSSSHTAGAVRIGRMARALLGQEPVRAQLLLHGSFASTGEGHGTHQALVAGLLGLAPDDPRVPDSFALARERGIPAIAALGRKGGSTVAAALCNALLYQSGGREKL